MRGIEDRKFMQTTFDLAEKARGKTSPNPMVGAIIVKSNRIIGQGYHKKAGNPHAEIKALEDAGNAAKDATLYVNLEPCCHRGRTKPCAPEIIKAGIRRVVYAVKDPNPLVNGKGAAMLRRAGIVVKSGVLSREARRLNEVYLKYIRTGRPYVILKSAQSLDGRLATSSGDSRWISCREARKFAHRFRAESDAVVIGSGTAKTDNPKLTVRLFKGKTPYRIVISDHPAFLKKFDLVKKNDDTRTIVATSKTGAATLSEKNLIIWSIKKGRHGLSLEDFLDKAGRFGITSLLIEGGGTLATSFIRAGLIDKHHIIIAPLILGRGVDTVGDLNIRTVAEALKFKEYSFSQCGSDILFTGYPEYK